MCDYTLHRGRKYFCRYCLQAFSREQILKCVVKDCYKIIGEQIFKMPKESEYVLFTVHERKTKSPFMIYTDFENILVQEDNAKQNLEESYTSKYQKTIWLHLWLWR